MEPQNHKASPQVFYGYTPALIYIKLYVKCVVNSHRHLLFAGTSKFIKFYYVLLGYMYVLLG